MGSQQANYGEGDATYRACGGEAGIRKLVDAFYDHMDRDAAYATIRSMHPSDLTVSRDKLSRFLCAWTGGPKLFSEKYGAISIPRVHAHLPITEVERDLWLGAMAAALTEQPYPADLILYLQQQLAVPAERIRQHRASIGREPGTG